MPSGYFCAVQKLQWLFCSPLLVAGVTLSAGGASAQVAEDEPAVEAAQEESGGQEQAGVVPPELIHYEPPVYPPAAFQQGLQAEVRLQLTVEEDGTVSDPEVVAPVGHGFDEAALEAALGLLFRPALVNGESRKVRIGFSYSFTLDEVEKEPEEQEEAKWGELGGQILLADSDTPLPGVQIQVQDSLGAPYSAVTDEEGRWSLAGLPAGIFDVLIEVEGFTPIRSQEEVVAGEATDIVFRLSVATTELEIVVEGERPPREVTRRTLQRREIERIPGTGGDALRSLQSLPGVARPPGLAGFLIVRGSSPGDTETFVDGTNIPLIYHFGGLSSVVPTELLDRIDFYPGNFSVRYGRLMGGVVDVGLRSPRTDCVADYGEPTGKNGCYHGMVQFDLIDGRFLLQGPVPGTKNWSFAVAGRRSWMDTWLKPVLEAANASVTSAPVYYDYQVIVDHNPRPGEKLSIRFFGSDDRFETLITTPSASDPGVGGNIRYASSFYRGQILYQKELTSKVSLDTMISVGQQSIELGLGGNIRLDIATTPIVARSEIGYRIHETARVNVGFDFLLTPYDVFVRAPQPPRPGESASGPLATMPSLESQASGFSFRPGWYTDVEWQPTKRLRVVPGLRVDAAQDSGHADVSPRLNARYSLFLPEDGVWGGKPLKTVLKGGFGKFSQPPQLQETDRVFGRPGLYSNHSMHYSLGVEQGLTEQVEISVEGFYKDLYGLVSRTPDALGALAYHNEGSGQVIGLETLLKYKADERFFGWIAYTLSESLRKDCAGCDTVPFQYDQTHNLIALGSYRLGDGWEIGARFRIISGPLTTPLVGRPALPAIYAGDAGSYLPINGRSYSERLPVFHQLDVRIDKRFQFRTWRLNMYLDIQNVYNNPVAEAYVYNYDFSQQAYQTGLPLIPSIGLRGEF